MMSVQSSFATKKPLKIRRCEKCGLVAQFDSTITFLDGIIREVIYANDNALIEIYGSDFKLDGEAIGYGPITSVHGGHAAYEPPRQLTGVFPKAPT